MKKTVALVALATALAAGALANAEGGCGRGWHRAPNGQCYVNGGGPGIVVGGPGVVVGVGGPNVGVFYGGRGWWDGHRYWGHRYWGHGGWRYR